MNPTEKKIRKAGGVILSEPLLDEKGNLNPSCVRQLEEHFPAQPPELEVSPMTPIDYGDKTPTGVYATHEGKLVLAGKQIRCYQLNTGERVLHAEDVRKFFGLTEDKTK